MCGICGLVELSAERTVDLALVRRMTAAMVHRGPDSEGFSRIGRVALGIRRLAIIDLTTGDQPVYNEDRDLVVVLNGEIYNYRNLARELDDRGHRFSTHSDTEVIVHAYEEWGHQCVERLRGMFAFALCDRRGKSRIAEPALFLARDRFGIKPLYYYYDGQRFLFASEVRALLASGIVPKCLCLAGLRSYLTYGSVQEPLTLVQEVYSLPSGSSMTIERGNIQTTRYWDLPEGTMGAGESELPDLKERLKELLAESVELRLISDVPLGTFLSGGIDSGAVTGLAAHASQRQVRSFNISFAEQEFDESPLAEATARRWGTKHERVVVTSEEVLRDLPQALSAMDQPTIDGINTWYVSRAAKQAGLTVALSGLGGDELFAGYHRSFKWVPRLMALNQWLHRVPQMLRQGTVAAAKMPLGDGRFYAKLAAFVGNEVPFGHPYYLARLWFTPRQQQVLLARELGEGEDWERWRQWNNACISTARTHDAIGEVSCLELRQYMLNQLLRDTDFMSMAHSLEVRVPFLDHILAELVLCIPGRFKFNGRTSKPLLVDVLDGILPQEVFRARKRGFAFPWDRWMKERLRNEVEESLLSISCQLDGILNSDGVKLVWNGFLAGRYNWSRPWGLYVLDRWCRAHL